jgi:class 3 adenylate cyclase
VKNLEELAEQLSMTELIRLQDVLSKAIVRRFEKRLALVFSDVVGTRRTSRASVTKPAASCSSATTTW